LGHAAEPKVDRKHWLQLLIFIDLSPIFFHNGRSFIIYHFPIPAGKQQLAAGQQSVVEQQVHLRVRNQHTVAGKSGQKDSA